MKKSFSLLALLPPPGNQSEEYSSFVNSSKNVEVDKLLDQPEDKRTSMRKEIFIKGKQNSLEDVILKASVNPISIDHTLSIRHCFKMHINFKLYSYFAFMRY